MLVKLREDGLAKGGVWSFLLIMFWTSLSKTQWGQTELASTPFGNWLVLSFIPVAFALLFYFKRRSVLVEIRYRRQHGKWRWER